MEDKARVIGVMSGSSLDGLDLACCDFRSMNGQWTFDVVCAKVASFPPLLRSRLLEAMEGSSLQLARLHRDFGIFIGEACKGFSHGLDPRPGLVASHGHTIFHKADEGLTTQVGCGAHIAAITGLPAVCDFRTKDVALGGQGAPLVPLGEARLFGGSDAFLNLGGIANVSIHHGELIGYDVSPCNQALNRLAEEADRPYDEDGAMARSGSLDEGLLHRLNALPFYQDVPPRSLGREWFEEHMKPVILEKGVPLADRMRTVTEHIAIQIAGQLNGSDATHVLISGGGARNTFLVERLRSLGRATIAVPEGTIIDFKEAIIFAFLGLLRWREEVNTLRSVTGARIDSIGGAVYLPN
jgi:anhydro-N-acetylmuramic acid kinase